jgi:hypothetical protein
MSDGLDSTLDVGAAAPTSAAALADPGEQELAGRLRSLLAHPAIWTDIPGAAAPPRPADLLDEIAPPPRPAEPSAGTAVTPGPPAAGETVGLGEPARSGDPVGVDVSGGAGPAAPATAGAAGLGDPARSRGPVGFDAPGGAGSATAGSAGPGDPAGTGEPVEAGGRSTQPVALPDRARRRRQRPRAWAAAIAGLAAAAALALFVVVPAVVPDREVVRVQLAGTGTEQGATASATAVRLAAGWRITLQIDGLPGAPADTYYEGWVRRGETYVPLGTFHLRQPGKVELWAGVAMTDYTSIVITRQQVGAGLDPAETVLAGNIQH